MDRSCWAARGWQLVRVTGPVWCDMSRSGQLEAEQGRRATVERFGLVQDQVEDEPQGQRPSGRRIETLRLPVLYDPALSLRLVSAASLTQTLRL